MKSGWHLQHIQKTRRGKTQPICIESLSWLAKEPSHNCIKWRWTLMCCYFFFIRILLLLLLFFIDCCGFLQMDLPYFPPPLIIFPRRFGFFFLRMKAFRIECAIHPSVLNLFSRYVKPSLLIIHSVSQSAAATRWAPASAEDKEANDEKQWNTIWKMFDLLQLTHLNQAFKITQKIFVPFGFFFALSCLE